MVMLNDFLISPVRSYIYLIFSANQLLVLLINYLQFNAIFLLYIMHVRILSTTIFKYLYYASEYLNIHLSLNKNSDLVFVVFVPAIELLANKSYFNVRAPFRFLPAIVTDYCKVCQVM